MSPKKRLKENRGFPRRWRWKDGAIRYQVPPGQEDMWDGKKEFTLGRTEAEAYRTWAERVQSQGEIRTIGDLLERYLHEVVPQKAPKTQESNRISIARLAKVFSGVSIWDVKPRHAYRYMDLIAGKHGQASANRDYEILSHAYSVAIRWGLIDRHPLKGQVQKYAIKRRERYVEDWELAEALQVAPPMLRAYVILKLLTGLRRGDLLRLRPTDLRDDGIHVVTHKTGTRLIIEWSPALREAVDAALQARPKHIAPWLFCTHRGQPYVKEDSFAPAFNSLWQRFMARALKQTQLEERFQEKDLRKKVGSDIDLDHARALLGHTTAETTRRHYRLRGERVKPAK